MERNVGGLDRTLRIVLGLALALVSVATVVFGEGLVQLTRLVIASLSLFLGAVLLATAGAETCPVNGLLGRNTYRGDKPL